MIALKPVLKKKEGKVHAAKKICTKQLNKLHSKDQSISLRLRCYKEPKTIASCHILFNV